MATFADGGPMTTPEHEIGVYPEPGPRLDVTGRCVLATCRTCDGLLTVDYPQMSDEARALTREILACEIATGRAMCYCGADDYA